MVDSLPEAKRAAIDLSSSLSFSVGERAGLRATPGALKAAIGVAQAVAPIKDSRKSPGDLPLDFFAPSPWARSLPLARLVHTRQDDSHTVLRRPRPLRIVFW
jgi:hypothetical protein